MTNEIRVLFVADSHLGLDLPAKPRVDRRRRGHDFLANHAAALETALTEKVDLVIHGGDVFDRPRVPASLAWQAYAPLVRIAEAGVPVFIVPGNHERGRLPHIGLAERPGLHVFDRPRTFMVSVRGMTLALSGFPYEKRGVRARFPELLDQTGWRATTGPDPDARLLCVHHCVEGATVGPGDYTFTTAADVIRTRDIPSPFSALLSGHIHRRQALVRDMRGQPLRAPVLYPGSIERTSIAEIGEPKGFMMLRLRPSLEPTPGRIEWEFRDLPARPMIAQDVDFDAMALWASHSDPTDAPLQAVPLRRAMRALDARIRSIVAAAPGDAVLRIRIRGSVPDEALRVVSPTHLRSFVPPTMNVEVSIPGRFTRPRRSRQPSRASGSASGPVPVRAGHGRPATMPADLQRSLLLDL
jgi:DNA repair exonuclease SbcCD nuclease subunit